MNLLRQKANQHKQKNARKQGISGMHTTAYTWILVCHAKKAITHLAHLQSPKTAPFTPKHTPQFYLL